MTDLKQLKTRFEKYPLQKKLRDISDNFDMHTKTLSRTRLNLTQVYNQMNAISQVFPDINCEAKVRPSLETAVREANKLYEEIDKDPNKILSTDTDSIIIKMDESFKKGSNDCRSLWESKIFDSVRKWEQIINVIHFKLKAKGGKELKELVDNLKTQGIPQDKKTIDRVKLSLDKLRKGIESLELSGPFGKFLEQVVGEGASLKDVFSKEIKDKIEEHNLWNAFRVIIN